MTKADFLAPADWSFPVPIHYGPGRVAEVGAICARLGAARPLIVTDRGSRALPFVEALAARLGAPVFADISPNPRDDEIGAGAEAVRSGGHDALVAIGGGSAMDGAKAIGMTALSGVSLWDFEYSTPQPAADAFPPLITIPTTAGTGAETESTAMITDTGRGMKFCLAHDGMRPAAAVLDPELALSLPRDLTAWTGADALTHAIEAYIVPGLHPLCDGAALEGLRLIAGALPRVVAAPDDLAARGAMLVGSCLAGVAFMKGLGLVHSISHMVGAEFDTHHGLTNAVVLPVVTRWNLPGLEAKSVAMGFAMGLEDRSPYGVIAAIDAMLDDLAIPRSLAEIGVPTDCAARIAEKAMEDAATATNPRETSLDQMRMLVETALTGAR